MDRWTRREFFVTTVAGSALLRTSNLFGKSFSLSSPGGKRPLMISSANGLHALGKGMDILKSGGDTLEAVIAAVTVVEDDPNDDSVGYGGLPNEEGVVELDASVMHGPTRRAGAVASVQKIKNPSLVAKAVMNKTNHVFIVGEGARRFAVDEGFQEMNLLTDRSRLAWLAWKATSSENWRPGLDSPEWKEKLSELLDTPERQAWAAHIEQVVAHPPTGTVNCLALNAKGEISGTTTTSGLAWKIPGRVEENIKISGGHTIVEAMRQGKSPKDACLEALDRVVRNYAIDKSRLKKFHLTFYALNKDGEHGSASLWAKGLDGKPHHYAVHDGTKAQLVPCAGYFDAIGGDY